MSGDGQGQELYLKSVLGHGFSLGRVDVNIDLLLGC